MVVILVTGATSATGSQVVRRLVEAGESVRCLVHTRAHEQNVPRETKEIIYGDLADPSDIKRALNGINTLINVAHIRHAEHLIPIAERCGVSRALFISSTRKYTRLDDPVAREIDRAEEIIRRSSLRYTILRPSMIYGDPRDRNVSVLIAMVKRLSVIPLPRGGKNLVQPVFVLDLVDAIVRAIQNDKTVRREYVLAGPTPMSYRQMIETIARLLRKRCIVVPLPLLLARSIAEVCHLLRLKIFFSPEQVLRFSEDRAYDMSEALSDIPFTPRSFEEGLRVTLHAGG